MPPHRSARRRDPLYSAVTRLLAFLSAGVAFEAARRLTPPPRESRHVAGVAIDVRPREGARWLEEHGAVRPVPALRHRMVYCPEGRPARLAHPDVVPAGSST